MSVPWWASSEGGVARWLDHLVHVGEVRRAVRAVAEMLGWPSHRVEEAAIVASELAANVVRHAGSGWLITQRLGQAIGLSAIDRGPGMADPVQCFNDGFTTAGTAGIGLGAIRRLADEHALDTRVGEGTVLCARLGPQPPLGLALGAAARPFPGQPRSGDGWRIDQRGTLVRLLVTDGLGHGPAAAKAAAAADRAFAEHATDDPVEMLSALDGALVGTRGAAAALAFVDLTAGEVVLAGIGNVAACLERGDERASLVPRFGVLGAGAPVHRVSPTTHPWSSGSRLVVYTDGISDRWRSELRRSRRHTSPSVLAGRILRDHLRRTDDATCVVLAARDSTPEQGITP